MLQALIDHGANVNATNTENVTALIQTVKQGNKDAINVLLNAGADPNVADGSGETCLHYAARNDCCTEVFQAIISHGGDVNATNKRNVTVLMKACVKGNKDTINVLLNAGADPNIANSYGDTCLHDAVQNDCCTEVLQAIISHGIDVNASNKNHVTALIIACHKGNTDAINILLEAGADPNITDSKGATCIHHAVGEGHSKHVLETVVSHGADVNAANKKSITALMLACANLNEYAINVLLNAGADPNTADAGGDTCLHYVAQNHFCTKVLQAIISKGIDVNATNKKHVTALIIACHKGNTDAINILLEAGADPNITDSKGATCIHHAVGEGCSKAALERIINNGADVNVMNKNNITTLMIACEKRNKDAINVVLNAGADPNIADADGDTCLHYAARSDCCTEVFRVIISHGIDVNATNKKHVTALIIACHKGNTDAINILLEAGADPNITDSKGATCIHHAVGEGCSEDVLRTIVNHGTAGNVTNKNNVTTLMIACEKGNKDVINVVLNAGADPNIADADGDTCLHYAARSDCCTEVLQAIISHGIDVNATNKKHITALIIACHKGNTDAINILLEAGADPNITDSKGATCIHHAVGEGCSQDVLRTIVNHAQM